LPSPLLRIPRCSSYTAGMDIEERAYWVAWSCVAGIGPARMHALLRAFGTLQAAWGQPLAALRAAGLTERVATRARTAFSERDPAAEWERLIKHDITVLTEEDPDYPERLRATVGAPALLFVRGAFTAADDLAVAIVGTRRMTSYGREVTFRLATGLAAVGVTVISGLAKGVDGIAHKAALNAGGRTLAVLGHGLDTIYPRDHGALAAQIVADGGALVTEYPPGTRIDPANFPARNRIISGLALGVVVVEADQKSGAMITADYAAEQGREVFAVPGSILSEMSVGCHALLRDGARLVTDVDDILNELRLDLRQTQRAVQQELPTLPGVPGADAVLRVLSAEPLHIDDLCRESGLAMSDLNSLLVHLMLAGAVRTAGPQLYVRV